MKRLAVLSLLFIALPRPLRASSGTEAAAFLDIPVGAGPAALGGAYTALATDAYAPVWNPGGLGFLGSPQISGQHVSYIDTLHYEYASFAVPFREGRSGFGGSVQYLGSGDINGTDETGNPSGTFSNYYASYNLAYGQSFDKLSLGLTGKVISAKLADAAANAYAADLGGLYRVKPNMTLGATLTNLGSKLKFLDDGDSLPMAFHLGGAYQMTTHWLMTAEGVFPKTGLAAFHGGIEWHPLDLLAIRTGYRTDTLKEASALAGYSLGLGLTAWGQEFSYAWLPYGDLGNTHYFSLLLRFGEDEKDRRKLIQYQTIKSHRSARHANEPADDAANPDIQQLMEILDESGDHVAQQPPH